MAIRHRHLLAATALHVAGLACGRATPAAAPVPGPEGTVQVLPASALYILEMAGIPPEDTMVTFPAGQRRTIVLRHGQPDNTVFAELSFPDSAFVGPDQPDSVTVVVRSRPGLYAIDLASTAIPRDGLILRFKYPVHFAAPLAAIERYGGTARYERALAIGALVDGTNYALLTSTRPASDNLEARIPGPGTYLVAAPR